MMARRITYFLARIIANLRRATALVFAASSLVLYPAPTSAKTDSLGVVHVAYSGRIFTSINKADAQIAIKIWARQAIDAMGIDAQPEMTFVNGPREIVQAIQERRLDLVSVDVMEYLKLQHVLEPMLVPYQGGTTGNYLLLVRRDQQWKGLADLRATRLVSEAGIGGESVSMLWLNVELLRAGLYSLQRPYFAKVEQAYKPMAVVLPVILGQADAALIYERDFLTLAEFNPQLKRELVALRHSPSLLPAIACVPKTIDPERREFVKNIARNIDSTPQGKQIMALFAIDSLQPFKPELLEQVVNLIAERDSLLAALAVAK